MSVERVLIVDDDEGLLNLMVLALRRRGYQVEQASNGFAALEIMAAQPPFSVLLTDMMMPAMTGLELLREARKLDAHIEVIVVTAAPDLDTAISSMRADGAYDYLLKPFESMNQLFMAVERAATQRRLLIEREQLRDVVQNEAGRLRALISSTGDAILSATADGTLQIANPAAKRLIGEEQLEGPQALQRLPAHLSTIIANWQAVGANLPAVVEMTWPDGSVQMVSLTPIPEDGGSRWGWVAVLRDISHIKRMEELKSQLLVEAASRIRIPLAQAMNALVELNILTSQNERAGEVVYRLTQIWKRIQEWGDDLNALFRIDSGIKLHLTSISMPGVLSEVRQAHSEQLLAAGIRLEVRAENELPAVMADPELIRRLINGLISRAISRSNPGASIRLVARSHNEQVWVSVSDDGPAVGDSDLPKIFEKSFVKTGSGPGVTGLEMALVKTIIDQMGGQVWVGGQGNKGGTIFVCLPTAARENAGTREF